MDCNKKKEYETKIKDDYDRPSPMELHHQEKFAKYWKRP